MTVKAKLPRKKGLAYIVLYFYMLLILLAVLTVASYTWFTLSRTPRVSNLTMNINAVAGMEFSVTPEEDDDWTKQLSYVDIVDETAPLRPVTWSDKEKRFYGAVYGIDGRLTGDWIPLSDERNANRDTVEGYYCIGTFYARSDDTVRVSLTPAVAVDEGGTAGSGTFVIGTPLWNSQLTAHENGGKGAECAVRIGIQIDRLDENFDPLEPDDEIPSFFIYEPNADMHVSDAEGYRNTPSIDGGQTLIHTRRLIPQTGTVWTETQPPLRDSQEYEFGQFYRNLPLFVLNEGEVVRIRLYVWLEGQDVDCTNAIADAQITANIQFLAQPYHEGGLVDKNEEDDFFGEYDEDETDVNFEDFDMNDEDGWD